MILGVLFDLDGVIVNTLHFHYLAWNHMFKRYRGRINERTILLHEGRNSREILPILMREAGIEIPAEEQPCFIEEKRAYYRKIAKPSPYPGAFEVIDELKSRGLKIALVTACALKNMQHSLNKKRRAHFDFIITGDETPRAKPFPDSYLAAASRLGIDAQSCLVVENAPLGIEAAKNAGMYCIAIETTLGKEYLKSADLILHDIHDLPDAEIFKRF